MKKRLLVLVSAFLIVGLTLGTSYTRKAEATVPGTNTLVSYNSTGTGPSINHTNHPMSVSEDGNIVVFYASASDLVSGVTGIHLFMRNISTNSTSVVDLNTTGAPAGVSSDDTYFAMSRTGRYVAYTTTNTNIVSSPSIPANTGSHVYLRDTLLNTSVLVDQSMAGVVGNGGALTTGAPYVTNVSDDGRFVAFSSRSNNLLASGNPASPNYSFYPYVKDLLTGQVIMLLTSDAGVHGNLGTGGAIVNSFSTCDGSKYVFRSNLTTLTPYDSGNSDSYMVDIRNGYHITNLTHETGHTISVTGISCNGKYLLVYSQDTNLTADTVTGTISHLFRYNILANSYKLVDKSTSGYISSTDSPSFQGSTLAGREISDNGRVVFIDYDTNIVSPSPSNHYEVYLSNPDAGTTELVPVNSSGVAESPGFNHSRTGLAISVDGQNIVYSSPATNLIPGITSGGGSPDGNVVLSKVQ